MNDLESRAQGLRRHLGTLKQESPVFGDAIQPFWQRIDEILSNAKTTGTGTTEQALADLAQEIRHKIDEVKRGHEIASFSFQKGQELWLEDGPATVTDVYRSKSRLNVRFQYTHGTTKSMIGTSLRRYSRDPETDRARYQRDKEYCTQIHEYMETLLDATTLTHQIQPYISWRIDGDKEARRSRQKLQEQYGWDDPAQLQRKAIDVLPDVFKNAKERKQVRDAVRSTLVSCRTMVLDGKLSVEDAKKNALLAVAELAASLAFGEAYQVLFMELRQRT